MGLSFTYMMAETAGRGPSSNAAWMLSLGILVLTATLLLRLRRKLRERAEEAEDRAERPVRPAPRRPGLLETASQRRTLEALMVEAQELTRLCAAQMENRAVRLEKLIREADERIARLDERHGARSREDVRVAERVGASSAFLRRDADPLTERIYQLADSGVSSVEIARELDEQTGKVDLILALRDR